ncbi:hypothetical protein J6590_043268 [Homalodisca vitripennis]|nr:hypothetical protein J6590_043268 [Homalodisca vitripennis]
MANLNGRHDESRRGVCLTTYSLTACRRQLVTSRPDAPHQRLGGAPRSVLGEQHKIWPKAVFAATPVLVDLERRSIYNNMSYIRIVSKKPLRAVEMALFQHILPSYNLPVDLSIGRRFCYSTRYENVNENKG